MVESLLDGDEVGRAEGTQVRALGEVLAQQPVRVLVAGALPGAGRVGEEDSVSEQGGELVVLSHLRALVPSKGLAQLRG
jgi:hypothetical protein